MNKLQNYLFILPFMLFVFALSSKAQVTMGSSLPPAKAAILQLKQWETSENADPNDNSNSEKGLGMPRVKLESLTSLFPFVDPASSDYELQKKLHQGMIVYNVNIDASEELELRPYTWNGAAWKEYLMRGGDLSLDVIPDNVLYNIMVTNPVTIPITVKWSPTFIPADIIVEPVDNRGVAGIEHASPHNIPQITDNTGSFSFTVKPIGATTQELVDSLFLTRTTLLHIRASDGAGKFLTKTITFLQKRHNLVLEGIDPYMELNREYKLTLRANSPWNLTITDPSVGGAFDIQEIPMSDVGDNFSKTYVFKLKNNIALEGNKMAFGFTSSSGEFPPIKYNFIPTQTYPNTYIVEPGKPLQIPLNKAYIVWANDLKKPIPDGQNITAELLWQDVPSAINAVIATPGNGGIGTKIVVANAVLVGDGANALVVAKMNGEVIWSWHLWITGYDPNKDSGDAAVDFDVLAGYTPTEPMSQVVDTKGSGKVYGYYNGRKTNIFMDRDLGALAIYDGTVNEKAQGYFFQHGRKDLMPPNSLAYTNGTYPKKILYDITGTILTDWDPVDNPNPTGFNVRNIIAEPQGDYLEESVRKPLDFFGVNGEPVGDFSGKNDYDWFSNIPDVHKGDMWNRDDNTKGNYDPCPEGWRVHPGGTGYDNPFLGIPFADRTKVEARRAGAISGTANRMDALYTDLAVPYLGFFIIDGTLQAPNAAIGLSGNRAFQNFSRFATTFGSRSISATISLELAGVGVIPVQSNIFNMNAKAHGFNVRCSRDFSNK